MSKLVSSLQEAIKLCGLKDGMTISFHHNFRNGDHTVNLVVSTIAEMGYRDIKINATGIYDIHKPLVEHMQNNVITGLSTNYLMGGIGKIMSTGVCPTPIVFRSHGGRDSALWTGECKVDITFIAASSADEMGNCNCHSGPSACGTLSYSYTDSLKADKVVVLTNNLVPYPTQGISIPETLVDYVTVVDSIGDPSGIMSGPLSTTKDPVTTMISQYATQVIDSCGLLKDGFSFQTGGGKASVQVARFMKDLMLKRGVQGSFIMGGIGQPHVDLLRSGCFRTILDVQCFDLDGIRSLREDQNHQEISIYQYAAPTAKSCVADSLDVVVVGATQIDTDFNINVHTDSNGYIIGGSGGHNDICYGSKIAIAVAPLVRSRIPIVVDKVLTTSTPGAYVDVLVTQRGIAVNPRRPELRERLKDAGLPIVDIHELHALAIKIAGNPAPAALTDEPVAYVHFRTNNLIDTIYKVAANH